MKKKQLLASLLCGVTVFTSSGVQAFADTQSTVSDFTATADILGGDLVVTVPDEVPLEKSGDNFVGTGTVTAHGTTNPKSVLTVWTNPEITYENQYKTDITVNADVTFGTDCTAQWTASELKDNITANPKSGYEVTATVPFSEVEYIGEYKTNILFNIELSSSDVATTYYMGYDYTDSTSVSYDNQNDIAYDILPQADTVAELKEFSTDKEAIEAKGYDKVIESSDESLVIPSDIEGYEVVGVSFDSFFADEDIATYVDDVEVPSSVTGVELSDTTSSASTTVITCENVRTAVNLSKKLPSTAKIRFQFEANGERDYTEFFNYRTSNGQYVVEGFSEYGYSTLKSYGADTTVEITMPVTYNGNEVKGLVSGGTYEFSEVFADVDTPEQVWILPDSYTICKGFWNDGGIGSDKPCTKLKGVILNEGLTTIASDAFRYCTSLETVVIPSTVTEIGTNAFADNPNLTSVTFADGFNGAIKNNAFAGTGLSDVSLPSSCTSLNGATFGDDRTALSVDVIRWGINHDVATITNASYLDNTLVVFADGNYIGGDELAVAESNDGINAVVSADIADGAFYNNEGKTYKTISIADGVSSIGKNAFRSCTAESISIPSTVTAIGANAFMACTAVFETLDLRNVSVGDTAFFQATIDTCIITDDQIRNNAVKSATINNLYIDYDGSVTLGSNVTKGCTITNVYFSGTEEEWTTFLSSYADTNTALTGANIIFEATMP